MKTTRLTDQELGSLLKAVCRSRKPNTLLRAALEELVDHRLAEEEER